MMIIFIGLRTQRLHERGDVRGLDRGIGCPNAKLSGSAQVLLLIVKHYFMGEKFCRGVL